MAILPLSLSHSLTSALSATSSGIGRPVARLLHPRVPSRPTVICLAAPPKVPVPIASPASLGDDPSKWDPAECDALLRGGEQVASVLQEMLKLEFHHFSHLA
ncbi:hypothetical protein OsI_23637 [Oryza sativa Indica Group]|uniref:Uncharacterized protein n=1 Tax=Oryza sativa subsp. indica TaxID=39946 RepID=A2YEU0_ORYSI|nr:hypothetical protein OsI_23637 [Oryza sativa Indica Group]